MFSALHLIDKFIIYIASFALVAAINKLYVALGSPVLPGWTAAAGDPCGEAWQGVQCNDSSILRMYGNLLNPLPLLSDVTWHA